MKEIFSDSNPWFKEAKSLIEKNRARKKSGKFVVEGIKEIKMACDAGFELIDLQINSLKKLKQALPGLAVWDRIEFKD